MDPARSADVPFDGAVVEEGLFARGSMSLSLSRRSLKSEASAVEAICPSSASFSSEERQLVRNWPFDGGWRLCIFIAVSRSRLQIWPTPCTQTGEWNNGPAGLFELRGRVQFGSQ